MFGNKIIKNEKEDSPNVIDNETKIKSNNEPDNEIFGTIDNEIENRIPPQDNFKEQDATDGEYIKDCSNEDDITHRFDHINLRNAGIFTNKKSKAEDEKNIKR